MNGIKKYRLNKLWSEINLLADGCKQIFILYLLEDYKHKEIAAYLNISESTSKSQYQYALKLTMNKFEKYLKENSNEIGKIDIDPFVWQSIENELLRKDNHKIRLYLRYAVSILILVVSAAILKYSIVNPDSKSNFSLSNYSQEYGIMEKPRSSKSDFKLLTNELEELDKQYKLYTELIGRVGYNEDLGMKVIEYFSLKLELLRKIQLEIIKVNNFEKSNNDENNIKVLHRTLVAVWKKKRW